MSFKIKMNSIFPFCYSSVFFLVLSTISVYIVKQVSDTQKSEKKIFSLQENIQNDKFSYQDKYKLGQLYLKKKLYNKAILLFREALKIWDYNDKIGLGSYYNTLGFTYFKLKQYDIAIYYYKIALKIIPDYILVLRNLAFTYERLGLYEKAFEVYNTALDWHPTNKIVLFRMILIRRKVTLKKY